MANLDIPSPYYRVSLKAIIYDAQQRLLVVQTPDGLWELPGGGWEHGETMQHCIRREIMEELGVGVSHIDFATMYPYSSKGRTGQMRLKLAVPTTLQSRDFTLGDGMQAVQCVSAAQLAKLDMLDSEAGIKSHIPRIWPVA